MVVVLPLQVGLGGWESRECMALENEIGTWQGAGELMEASNALRSPRPHFHPRIPQSLNDNQQSVGETKGHTWTVI